MLGRSRGSESWAASGIQTEGWPVERDKRGTKKKKNHRFVDTRLLRIKHARTFSHSPTPTVHTHPGRGTEDCGEGTALHELTQSGGRVQRAEGLQTRRGGHRRVRVLLPDLLLAGGTGALQQGGGAVETRAEPGRLLWVRLRSCGGGTEVGMFLLLDNRWQHGIKCQTRREIQTNCRGGRVPLNSPAAVVLEVQTAKRTCRREAQTSGEQVGV